MMINAMCQLYQLSPLSFTFHNQNVHFQQDFSYTVEVSYLSAEEAEIPGRVVSTLCTFTISSYTSTPCHGHISSARMLTFLPTD